MDAQLPYQYSHCIFFQLSDRTPATRRRFLELTWELLATGHPGMLDCAIGFRDVAMQRPVNDQKFDISVIMIFRSFEDYQAYRRSKNYDLWVTSAGSMSIHREVFDSFLLERPRAEKPTEQKVEAHAD